MENLAGATLTFAKTPKLKKKSHVEHNFQNQNILVLETLSEKTKLAWQVSINHLSEPSDLFHRMYIIQGVPVIWDQLRQYFSDDISNLKAHSSGEC